MDHVDVVVIGAGVVGAAIAYDLASYGIDTLVLEGSAGPAAGASGANAGIIDTGYSSPPGSFETSMILVHGRRWHAIFDELGIPYRVCGAILIAQDSEQASLLPAVERNAQENDVKVRAYDHGQLRQFEPKAKAAAGLLIPGEAITDPYEVVSRLLAAGPKVLYNSPVTAVQAHDHEALVQTESGDVVARFVVNCAGLFADDIAGDRSFSVTPQRGACVVFPEEAAVLTDHILFPMPSAQTKGLMIFPTIYGHLCACAASADQSDKNDWKVRPEESLAVQAAAAKILPKLADFKPIDSWVGLRAVGHPRNYIAEWSKRVACMFNVAGIATAGLSASFGLSAYVLDRCRERGLEVKQKSSHPARVAGEPTHPWWQRRKR